jgi:hypothetical protein
MFPNVSSTVTDTGYIVFHLEIENTNKWNYFYEVVCNSSNMWGPTGTSLTQPYQSQTLCLPQETYWCCTRECELIYKSQLDYRLRSATPTVENSNLHQTRLATIDCPDHDTRLDMDTILVFYFLPRSYPFSEPDKLR